MNAQIGYARHEGPADQPEPRTDEDIAADLLALREFRLQMVGDAYHGDFGAKVNEAYERGQSLADLMVTASQDYLSELVAHNVGWWHMPAELALQQICNTWGVNRYE